MTDLIPNDLSHLSDDEFDAPGPEPLSPAAKAVLAAYGHHAGGIGCILDYELRGVASALRAAADQVVPGDGSRRANEIRSEFLAIVTELENHQ